jgi:hypothetical protein
MARWTCLLAALVVAGCQGRSEAPATPATPAPAAPTAAPSSPAAAPASVTAAPVTARPIGAALQGAWVEVDEAGRSGGLLRIEATQITLALPGLPRSSLRISDGGTRPDALTLRLRDGRLLDLHAWRDADGGRILLLQPSDAAGAPLAVRRLLPAERMASATPAPVAAAGDSGSRSAASDRASRLALLAAAASATGAQRDELLARYDASRSTTVSPRHAQQSLLEQARHSSGPERQWLLDEAARLRSSP